MQPQAVVIGSGMCGLATAQALSSFFDHVIVLERDAPDSLLPQSAVDAAVVGSKARPGVQQYHQLHALTSKGLLMYDDIFDGKFTQMLAAAGATMTTQHQSVIFHHPSTGLQPWLRNIPLKKEEIQVAFCTRHLFETSTRMLVMENPRVHFKYGVVAAGLQFGQQEHGGDSPDKHVTGVCLSDSSVLAADLVVDCSGRGSSLPNWLAAAGCQRPRTTRATVDGGYSSWLCRLAPDVEKVLSDSKVQGVATFPAAPETTACLLFHVEGDMWVAAVGGNEGMYPGRGEEAVMRFAQENVWHPSAGRLLAGSTFLAPVYQIDHLNSTWRHYEEVALPEGLLVLGDAVCSLNPTYGQGMTVAAAEVVTLKQLLSARAAAAAFQQGTAQAAAGAAVQRQGVSSSKAAGCGAGAPVGAGVAGSAALEPSGSVGLCEDAIADSDQVHLMQPTPPASGHPASASKAAAAAAAGAAGHSTPTCATHSTSRTTSTSTSSSGGTGSTCWLAGLHTQLQAAIVPHIKAAWNLAVGTDLRYAGSTINEPFNSSLVERAAGAYVQELFGMAASDPVANEALLRVMSMLDPPESLLQPQVLARFAAFKAAQYTPTPLKRLAAAWLPSALQHLFDGHTGGQETKGSGTAGGGGTSGATGSQAALAELMGWPKGWREPAAKQLDL